MTAHNQVIAIVDDDELVRRALRRLVRSLAYEPAEFSSGEAFLDSLESGAPSCALLDLHMPGLNGLQVLEALRRRNFSIPTIVITGNSHPDMRELCMEAGAVAYLQKPLDRELVFSTIQGATAV